VPASHAQQWPQEVASDLQGLVKDGVSYVPVYSIWAHWHNLEWRCQSIEQTFIRIDGDNLGSKQAVWAACVDECTFATYTSSVLFSSFDFLLSQASAR
jgi:hypothetical protein